MVRLAKNECCTWDFTISKEGNDNSKINKSLKEWCKKWVYQLEEGKGGYKHYQGRLSLKLKTRSPPIFILGMHYSVTSKANMDNDFYVIKEDSRIDGPWSSEDPEIYIPLQYRDITLYPYQKMILDSRLNFDPRKINLIYDKKGNKGKSTVASIGELLYNAIDLPPVNDAKELIQVMANICIDTNNRHPGLVFIDMPRAMNKESLCGMYTAIEQIKKGKLYDMRYHYKAYWIDSPQIWVFTNIEPNMDWLSADRWNIYTIKNNTLKGFCGALL